MHFFPALLWREISSCKIYNKTTGTIAGTTYVGGEFSFGDGE